MPGRNVEKVLLNKLNEYINDSHQTKSSDLSYKFEKSTCPSFKEAITRKLHTSPRYRYHK